MILEKSDLETMKMAELRNLMGTIGGSSEAGESKEALINRILLQAAKQPDADPPADEDPRLPKNTKVIESHEVTLEQLKTAIQPYILRGMKFFYNANEKTWLFRIKLKAYQIRDTNSGETRLQERWRDDSGTMKQPITTIIRCASLLMQNAPRPGVVEQQSRVTEGFESIA